MNTKLRATAFLLLTASLLITGCGLGQATRLSIDNASKVEEIAILEGHAASISVVLFSPDGTLLASGDNESSIRLWDVKQAKELKNLEGPSGHVADMLFDSDGKTIIAITGNFAQEADFHKLRQWDVRTYEEVLTYADIDWNASRAAATQSFDITRDGRWMALNACEQPKLSNTGGIVCGMAAVSLMDLENKSSPDSWPACLLGSGMSVWQTEFSPDGTLVGVSGGGNLIVCDFDSEGAQGKFNQEFDFRALGIAFSPDGKNIAVGVGDGSLHLYDIAAEKELTAFKGHTEPVISVAFSPDGSLLASGGVDQTVRIWNAATGDLLTTLEGHTDYVVSLAFSPDGSTLVSGSYDKTVRLWGLP